MSSTRPFLSAHSWIILVFWQLLWKKKGGSLLPDNFALYTDGWTDTGCYYLCVFATFSTDSKIEFEIVLFRFTPLSENDLHSAEVRKEMVQFVLDVFWKCKDSTVVLIVDDCTTIRPLFVLIFCGGVGFLSLRYNSAARTYINEGFKLASCIRHNNADHVIFCAQSKAAQAGESDAITH